MNKYHIRIDGKQSTNSYTYQELEGMGLFELDADSLNGIEVKKVTNKVFKPLKSYCFLERQSNESSYSVDEYGQSTNKNGVYVDEYGQIVRSNNSTSSLSSSTSSSSTPSSNNSSSSDGRTNFGKIIGTIVVLIIGFAIASAIADAGGGKWIIAIPLIIGYWILKAIWDWDD